MFKRIQYLHTLQKIFIVRLVNIVSLHSYKKYFLMMRTLKISQQLSNMQNSVIKAVLLFEDANTISISR